MFTAALGIYDSSLINAYNDKKNLTALSADIITTLVCGVLVALASTGILPTTLAIFSTLAAALAFQFIVVVTTRVSAACHNPEENLSSTTQIDPNQKREPNNFKSLEYIYHAKKEVAAHITKADGWIIINNDVYVLNTFFDDHPGGEQVLLDSLGQDASQDFRDVEHSTEAQQMMSQYKLGSLEAVGRYVLDKDSSGVNLSLINQV